eukprot:754757-Hanusia_phi.AAC.2
MARIQAWGSNQYGQLGYDGLDSLIPTSPKIIHNLEPGSIRQLALGGGHSLALDTEGIVWSWGWNAKGQLGRNSHDTESCDALPVGGLPSCHIVSAGHEESFAIDDSHCLWAFGKGRSVAYKVTEHLGLGEEGFQDADGGVFHAAAATIDGSCIFWGKHAVIPDEDAAVRIGGDTIRWKPPDGSKVVQVACGWKHTVMLDNLGRVWGVGSNKHGQLGRHIERSIPFPKRISEHGGQIDAGWSHTVVLYLDHTLSAIGRNNFGQCSAFEGCWDDVKCALGVKWFLLAEAASYSQQVGMNMATLGLAILKIDFVRRKFQSFCTQISFTNSLRFVVDFTKSEPKVLMASLGDMLYG